MLGAGGVGKTAMIMKYLNKDYVLPTQYYSTIEDHLTMSCKVDEQYYRLDVLDTAGFGKYVEFSENCLVGVDVFLVVFAVDQREGFEVVEDIVEKIVDSFKLKFSMFLMVLFF